MPITYNCIANTVLTSTASTISFTSISQSFSDLVFRFTLQYSVTGSANTVPMTWNGSATGYSQQTIYGGSAVNPPKAQTLNSRTYAGLGIYTSFPDISPVLFVGEYSMNTYSSALNRNPVGIGQTGTQRYGSGAPWGIEIICHQNSLSVTTTSVTFTSPGGVPFAIGSQISMYGILRA